MVPSPPSSKQSTISNQITNQKIPSSNNNGNSNNNDNDNHQAQWWKDLPKDNECPITLEPICELPYPPFSFSDNDNNTNSHNSKFQSTSNHSCHHYFDGVALASYVVSRGTFQNPLTRQPMTFDDCRRLDSYLERHCFDYGLVPDGNRNEKDGGGSGNMFQVTEAFSLRESIHVKSSSSSSLSEQRRAEALRNEAAAALRGLFVFRNYHTRKTQNANRNRVPNGVRDKETKGDETVQRIPSAGFQLHRPVFNDATPSSTWNATMREMEGLTIIDDDLAVGDASNDAAWKEIQDLFPPLVPSDPSSSSSLSLRNGNVAMSNQASLLQTVRETAKRTHQEEDQQKQRQLQRQEQIAQHVLQRRMQRKKEQEQQRMERERTRQNQTLEEERICQARREIEQWRNRQWDDLYRWADGRQLERQRQRLLEEEERRPREERDGTKKLEDGDMCRLETVTNAASTTTAAADTITTISTVTTSAAETKTRKAAEKRRRARERQKAKKALEREELRKQNEAAAKRKVEQEERERAVLKCSACGRGILGVGFEKLGRKFCSTPCARAGAASSSSSLDCTVASKKR